MITIRTGQPGDGQGLAQVWLDAATYDANLDAGRFQVPDPNGLADWFEERWARPIADDQFARVAEVNGQVVGLVHAVLVEPLDSAPRQLLRELAWRRLMVNALAVRTAVWRHAIGRQLLGAAEEWGRGRGARIAVLDTYLHSAVSGALPRARDGLHAAVAAPVEVADWIRGFPGHGMT